MFAVANRSPRHSLIIISCSALLTLAACGKKEEEAKPAAEAAMPSTALEGRLDIVAWPGYIERGVRQELRLGDKVRGRHRLPRRGQGREYFRRNGHAAVERRTAAEPARRCLLAAGRQCALRPGHCLG